MLEVFRILPRYAVICSLSVYIGTRVTIYSLYSDRVTLDYLAFTPPPPVTRDAIYE